MKCCFLQVKRTSEYDVRVIHLVRDPRPLVRSRASSGFGTIDGITRHPEGRKYTDEVKYGSIGIKFRNNQYFIKPIEWLHLFSI